MVEHTKEDLERFAPNDELLDLLDEAEERGDEKLVKELRGKMIWPAETLLATRRSRGADWLIKMGYNCAEAERKYGKDWLHNDRLLER